MMAVTRRYLNRRPVAVDQDWAAPLDRQALVRSRVPARAAFGVLLVGYSTVATVVMMQQVAAPALAVHGWGSDVGIGIGLLLATILTAGQWISSGYNRLAYLAFLAPDVAITYWFSLPMLLASIPSEQLAMAAAALWAIICARFGEVLLFGGVR